MSMTVCQNDFGTVFICADSITWDDGLIDFAAAGELPAGTLLALDTATDKHIPFVKGGAGDAGIPTTVLPYPLKADAAGTFNFRFPLKGKFKLNRMIIDADGDASNIDRAVINQLRDFGILLIETAQLGA